MTAGRRTGDRATRADRLFRLPGARERDPGVELWLADRSGELAATARRWFDVMRQRGDDVRELMHDGCPTACVDDAAFAYVGVYRVHVSVGFFRGTALDDPHGLLEGTGKFMRHVKIGRGQTIDEGALMDLIDVAYKDMKRRLGTAPDGPRSEPAGLDATPDRSG